MNGVNVEGEKDKVLDNFKQAGDQFEIILRRQLEIIVNLEKNGPFGLTLDSDTGEIQMVMDGMIKDYNRHCLPNVEICSGDYLRQVGDLLLSPNNILESLSSIKEGETINLRFE